MKLYGNPASPFARKALVVAHVLGIKLEVIDLTPPYGTAEFRRINPLGKIPALILGDGSAIFDSRVICEYLNRYGGGKFFPGNSLLGNNKGQWKALTLQALADGLCDAAVGRVVEGRQPNPNPAHIDRHTAAMEAALDALERVKFSESPTIGEIAAGVALGYVDFRFKDLDWRATRPKLSAWYGKFSQYPAMQATQPK